MPQKIFCSKCNNTLYQGLEPEIPDEIVARHGGKCPYCKEKLDFDARKVKINPYNGNSQDYVQPMKLPDVAPSWKNEPEIEKPSGAIQEFERQLEGTVRRVILRKSKYGEKR